MARAGRSIAGRDRTGPGTRRPGLPSGQGIAPTGTARQVLWLHLELVPLRTRLLRSAGRSRA